MYSSYIAVILRPLNWAYYGLNEIANLLHENLFTNVLYPVPTQVCTIYSTNIWDKSALLQFKLVMRFSKILFKAKYT